MATLRYYHAKRDHTVELQEHQTVQRQALERIGYVIKSEGAEPEEGDLLELSIPELGKALAGIEDESKLVELYEAEEAGQRRKGALTAIAARVQELGESDDGAGEGASADAEDGEESGEADDGAGEG